MEADWEFEIGPGAPVIDAAWEGCVDMVRSPGRYHEIVEAREFPLMIAALLVLNGPGSPVWTSKCDLWPALEAGAFDADEMEAGPDAVWGAGGYLDVLMRDPGRWASPEAVAADCRAWVKGMRGLKQPGCRVDLIVREAVLPAAPETDSTQIPVEGFGVTAYWTACGAEPEAALQTLGRALAALAAVLSATGGPTRSQSPLQ